MTTDPTRKDDARNAGKFWTLGMTLALEMALPSAACESAMSEKTRLQICPLQETQ
jgi:hypothetical protein